MDRLIVVEGKIIPVQIFWCLTSLFLLVRSRELLTLNLLHADLSLHLLPQLFYEFEIHLARKVRNYNKFFFPFYSRKVKVNLQTLRTSFFKIFHEKSIFIKMLIPYLLSKDSNLQTLWTCFFRTVKKLNFFHEKTKIIRDLMPYKLSRDSNHQTLRTRFLER